MLRQEPTRSPNGHWYLDRRGQSHAYRDKDTKKTRRPAWARKNRLQQR